MSYEQEIFNKAYNIYFECQNKLFTLYDTRNNKNIITKQELINEFDIMLHVIMLYVSCVDDNVSDIELSFIQKITVEEDILKIYNDKLNLNMRWDDLKNDAISDDKFQAFVDKTLEAFSSEINRLIMFISLNDALTKENYYEYFKQRILDILELFIKIDKDDDKVEYRFIPYIIEKVFLEKYRELKDMFEKINGLNI